MTKFINESKPITRSEYEIRPGSYGYDAPSPYLLAWSSLFQSMISQAGTYMLTKKFHTQQTGIYKAEGGCNIAGIGELVLGPDSCRFNYDDKATKKHCPKLASMITSVILTWDPMNPIESMLKAASEAAGCSAIELAEVLKKHIVTPFNGNPISYFFGWNSGAPTLDRKYLRWSLINISGQPADDVDRKFKDEDMADDYLKKLQSAYRDRNGTSYKCYPTSCRALRMAGEVKFIVNCSSSKCNMDGSHTAAQIESFLKSDENFHE